MMFRTTASVSGKGIGSTPHESGVAAMADLQRVVNASNNGPVDGDTVILISFRELLDMTKVVSRNHTKYADQAGREAAVRDWFRTVRHSQES